ncbi:hypothetical protein [Croceicoccus sp. BE223]|uniref:hypothetical protein n=1 Tax=Croceicoccus sp. BE223 TaxID=2817716 RepID=UPI002866E9A8|nr:hypothetical protein [Croceicoccus sp. BE223]MDR7103427.1 hypothetical protein [Croceicoccus sp. BE223]
MTHSGSARVILGTAVVALSIMAAKTALPAIPMQTTVLASAIGMVLIFLLYRSDAHRRRQMAARTDRPAVPEASDPDTIRRRMEDRPVPQFRLGKEAPALPTAPAAERSVLELVREVRDERSAGAAPAAVFELTPAMERIADDPMRAWPAS